MRSRWRLSLAAGIALLSVMGCAESLHQTQRAATLSRAQDNDYADVYYEESPFFYSPGFWWSPFGYYPGYYGPGYRRGYPGYYPVAPSGPGGSAPPSTPPPKAPPQFFKRKN